MLNKILFTNRQQPGLVHGQEFTDSWSRMFSTFLKVTFSNFILDVYDMYEADFSLQSLEFYFLFDFWWED